MAALSDHIDRLSRRTRSIQSIAVSSASSGSGPFTRALLSTQLGDLIRDVDSSEMGLFTVTASSNPVSHDKETRNPSGVEITRAEFHGATPLRKATGKRDDLKPKEVMPEVYANAALNYIERYQHLRPMPRTHAQVTAILDQLEESRQRIRSMTEFLRENPITEAPPLKFTADTEQQKVDQLEEQIEALRKRKEFLSKGKLHAEPSPVKTPPRSLAPVDPVEEQFWSTPGTTARALHFTDNLLMDEEADFGDMSMASSISSPMPSGPIAKTRLPSLSPEATTHKISTSFEDGEAEDEEETVILPPSPSPTKDQEPDAPAESQALDTPHKGKRVRINMEVERVVARIWSTAGELIMPGNNFNSSTKMPPVAKATIAHLQSLSSLTPTMASPTHSISTASKASAPPTAQQILTAHLLLALLSSETLSLSLNKAKELITAKASTSGSAALVSGHSRIVYGCVAKRLLKIERGAGGQVVKFDT